MMMSGSSAEQTLRLQFGTAATTIGTQWRAMQHANEEEVRAIFLLPIALPYQQTLTGLALHPVVRSPASRWHSAGHRVRSQR